MPARTTKTKKQEIEVVLPKKKVEIEVLNRRVTNSITGGVNESESVFLTGTHRVLPLQQKARGGFVDPFAIYYKGNPEAATELRELLEDELDLEPGALRTAKAGAKDMAESVWSNSEFKLTFRKKESALKSATISLNLENPVDFIQYLVALSWTEGVTPLVAPTWAKRNDRASYRYVIRDLNADQTEHASLVVMKAKVSAELNKLHESNSPLLAMLYNYLSANDYTFKPGATVVHDTPPTTVLVALSEVLYKSDRAAKVLTDALSLSDAEKDAWRVYFKARNKTAIRAVSYSANHTLGESGKSIGRSAQEAVKWLMGSEGQELKLALDQD